MPSHDAPESARGLAVPTCESCHQPDGVRPLHVSEVDPQVQYWVCRACGFVWATRDGRDLRAIAAERSARRSA
jgi:hypothetical protein